MTFEGKQPVSVDHPINCRLIVSEKKISFLVLNFFGISYILPTLKTAGKGNVWPFLWFGNVLVFVS